jgi:RecA-family ATPase
MSAEDFTRLEIPPKRNIVKPWLKEQSITLISGWRGTGKTWLGISILDAVTRGQQFGPWEIETPVSSLYLDGEMASYDIQDRLMQISKSTGVQRKVPLYIYSDAYANILGIPRASLLSDKWRDALKALALDKGIKLLALDNISSLAPGVDENSKFEWDPINQWLLTLRFAGVSTILFHHTGKEGGQRGTSAREDNVDTSILLHRPPDYVTEQGARFVIKFKKTRVSMKELALLTEIEFALAEIDDQAVWTWGTVKKKNKIEILKMIDEGIPQVDIAKALDVSKGFVSQVKTKAIKEGFLTQAGKLTQSGFMLVNSGEGEDGDD